MFKVGDIVYSLITNDTNTLYEVIEITDTSGTTKYNILTVDKHIRFKQYKRQVYLNADSGNIRKVTADKALKAKITILFHDYM